MPIQLNDDDGFAEVEIGEAKCRLDLFRAFNTYNRLADAHPDPVELADAWADWLAEQGLPRLSHGVAFELAAAVGREVGTFQKKRPQAFGPRPDSPASTGSTASASDPPS